MKNPQESTRFILKLNATFSSLVGLDLIVFNDTFMSWMGISHALILPLVGVGLILFGLFVAFAAMKRTFSLSLLKGIIVQDISWVLACLVVAPFNLLGLSSLGNGLILLSALLVGLLAFFQYKGLKSMAHTTA